MAEVSAAFQLGGGSSCGISEIETVATVCMGYGVDIDILLDVLEELMADEKAPETAEPEQTALKPDETPAPIE